MAKSGIDLQSELDRLYASVPSEFTAARNALVKSLEGAGRKEDAARVKALKKPNAAAWGVNQLALSAPRLLAKLVATGDRLRACGSDPREAMQKRREAVDEARREVERAFQGAGLAANPDVLRRVSTTLEAIATYGSASGGPEAGRLAEDVPAPGFDDIVSLGLLGDGSTTTRSGAARARPREAPPARTAPPERASKRDAGDARRREEKRREEARKQLAERTKAAAGARRALEAAEKAVEAIRRKRASLEAALSDVAAEEKSLEAERAAARDASEKADAAEKEARGALPRR